MTLKKIFFLFLVVFAFSAFSQPLINAKIGGKEDDIAYSALQTPLGDYVLAGASSSNNQKLDIWVTRRDKNGEKVWEKFIGGASHDFGYKVIQSKEGKFVVCGYVSDPDAKSNSGKATVICLSPKGEVEWQYNYGGGKGEKAMDIVQARDGGFVFVGYTKSYAKGQQDAWVVKLDAQGKMLWQKSLGGPNVEDANAVTPAKGGGYIVVGRVDTKIEGSEKYNKDIYIVKVDEAGKELWSKTIKGAKNEEANAVVELPDGRIAVAGWTASKGAGRTDGNVILMTREGNFIWDKTFGKAGIDGFNAVSFVQEGEYLVAAGNSTPATASEGGMWVVKMDLKGNIIWERNTNNDKDEQVYSTFNLTGKDGGFLLAGYSNNDTKGGRDAWLLTLTNTGTFKVNQPAPPPAKIDPPVVDTKPKKDPKPGIKDDPSKPNLYILSVGVSQYNETKYNLTYAHSDADSIAEMFATMKGKLYNKVEVTKLLNKDATLTNIKKSIQWLEEQATQRDMIVMFFSCHGALDHKGNLYILPHDFSPVSLFATGLNIKDITNGINGTPCKKLIFMDACHSGEAGQDMFDLVMKDPFIDNVVKEIAEAEPGITLMTSSTGKEYSYEKPSWGHGAFTKAILEALSYKGDYNKDRIITINELNNYVSERVKNLTGGKQHPYTPVNLFGNIPVFYIQ